MPINVNGNKINTFGETLPIPYLDRVEIFNESIKVFYSYYFQKPQDADDDEFIAYAKDILRSLKTAIFLTPKYELSSEGSLFHVDTVPFAQPFFVNEFFDVKQAILDDSTKIYDLFRLARKMGKEAKYSLSNGRSQIVLSGQPIYGMEYFPEYKPYAGLEIDYCTFTGTPEIIYDATGAEVKRFAYDYEISIPPETSVNTFSLIQAVTSGLYPELELCLLMASTSLDVIPHLASADQKIDNLFLSAESEYFRNLRGQQISDINYETIAVDGNFKALPRQIYRFVSTGNPHTNGDVMQTIDTLYNAIDTSVRTELINNVTQLTQTGFMQPDQIGVAANPNLLNINLNDEQLNDAIDNISYVLEVFGSSPKLLRKLNEAASAFPTTSTATAVGRLHERLEIAIFNANAKIKNLNSEVVKQVNLNTYVKDLRTSPVYQLSERYEEGAKDDRISINQRDEYIYHSSFDYSCYLDPNSYEQRKNAGDDFSTYSTSFQDISNDDINMFMEGVTGETIQTCKQSIIEIFREHMSIGQPRIGDGFLPDSDLAKIILFLGDPTKLNQSLKHIFTMLVVSIDTYAPRFDGQNQAGQGFVPYNRAIAVDFAKYVSGLSDHAKIKSGGDSTNRRGFKIENATTGLPIGIANMRAFYNIVKNATVDYILLGEETGQGYASGLLFDVLDQFDTDYSTEPKEFDELFISNESITKIMRELGLDEAASMYRAYAAIFFILNTFEENLEYSVTEYNAYLAGYWWFDYEKAMRERSAISLIYNISKLDDMFGKNFTNHFYQVHDTKITRWFYRTAQDTTLEDWVGENTEYGTVVDFDSLPSTDSTGMIKIGSVHTIHHGGGFDNLGAGQLFPASTTVSKIKTFHTDAVENYTNSYSQQAIDYGFATPMEMQPRVDQKNTESDPSEPGDINAIGLIGVDVIDNQDTEYTYNLLRNFKILNDPQVNEYRLMCFEHQEVAGPFNTDSQRIKEQFSKSALHHQVTTLDNSIKAIYYISKIYKDLLQGDFENYYQSAIEQCSYNSTDQTFNEFFKTNAKQEYASNPSEAPWYTMPVMYHYHLDLLYNTYAGNKDAMYIASLIDTEKISPESGTFDMLNAFHAKVNDLFTTQYNSVGYGVPSVLNRLNDAYREINLETHADLNNATSMLTTFNNTLGTGGDAMYYAGIPKALNLINTVKEDKDSDEFYRYGDSPHNIAKEFANAIAKLLVKQKEITGKSYNALHRDFIDGPNTETAINVAQRLAEYVWDIITDPSPKEDNNKRLLDTDGNIAYFDDIIERFADHNFISRSGNDFFVYLFSIRRDIYNYLTTTLSTDALMPVGMHPYNDLIDDAIRHGLRLMVTLATTTYSYLNYGSNPSQYSNYDTNNATIIGQTGDARAELPVLEYIHYKIQHTNEFD